MAADSTEEEQVEALKTWFEENGVSLLLGIVLALGGVFGYRAWENSTREAGEAASAIYEDLVAAVGTVSGDGLSEEMTATGIMLAEQLKTEYSDSSYALFGALHMAKVAVEAGNLDKAAGELQWALDNGAQDSFEILARIRLSRVMSAQEKYEQALAVLDVQLDLAAHRSSWEEARGDIYFSMGQLEDLTYAKVTSAGEEPAEPEDEVASGSGAQEN